MQMHHPCVFKRVEDSLEAWELLYPAGTFSQRKRLPQLLAVSESPSSPRQENIPRSLQGDKAELVPGTAAVGLPADRLDGARPAGGRARSVKGGPREPQRGAGHSSVCTKIHEASCWTPLAFKHWCMMRKNKLKHSNNFA